MADVLLLAAPGPWRESALETLAQAGFDTEAADWEPDGAGRAIARARCAVVVARGEKAGAVQRAIEELEEQAKPRLVAVGRLRGLRQAEVFGEAVSARQGTGPALAAAVARQLVQARAEKQATAEGAAEQVDVLRRQVEQLLATQHACLEAASALRIDVALQRFAEGVREALELRRAIVCLRERPRGRVRVMARAPKRSGTKVERELLRIAREAIGKAESEEGQTTPAPVVGRGALVAPFFAGEGIAGALAVVPGKAGQSDAGLRRMVGLLASQAASLVRHARLYETARQRTVQMAELVEAGRTLSASVEVEDILEGLLENAQRLTKADRCFLFWAEEAGGPLVLRFARGVTGEAVGKAAAERGKGLVGYCAAAGHPVVVADVAQEARIDAEGEGMLGRRGSLVAVPIRVQGLVQGVLVAQREREGEPLGRGEAELLALLASNAASAVENASLYEHLREAATRDGLTGLYNYQHLMSQLRSFWKMAQRYGQPLSLLMLDLDDFKQVNDRYGHAQGDVVLRAVATTLQRTSRGVDVVARYGGEEFAIIAPHTEAQGARQMAERIRQRIAQLRFTDGGEEFQVTASVGVATYEPSLRRPAELLERADQALYCAKRAGKNCVHVYRTDDGKTSKRMSDKRRREEGENC